MFVYLLSEVFFFFCMLFASAPPDTASPRVPGRCGSAFSGPGMPQRVLHSPRAGVSAWRPAGHGLWGLSLMEGRVCWTGALAALRGPGHQGPMQSSFFQFFLLLRLIRAHHHPERPLPYPPRWQPKSSSRASSWNLSLPARSTGQHMPLPVEQVPHT